MPTALGAPHSIQDFAHADDLAVEYVLHPATTRVRVFPVGDSCRVHLGNLEPEGSTIGSYHWPIADGESEAFPFTSARPTPDPGFTTPAEQGRLRGVRARTEGRRIFVALDVGPGTVRILSERG